MEGFWSRQIDQHARPRHRDDAAHAVRPARRARHRFRHHLPDRRARHAAHRRRRDAARRDPRLQHRHRRLLRQAERPADPGRDDPDAHARGGDRRARVRHQAARRQGRHVRQRHRRAASPTAKDADPDARPAIAVAYEQFGIDSDHDYDPVWQKCRELGIAPTFHTGGRGFGLRNSPEQLHLQPYRPFRRRRPRGRQGRCSSAA